MNKTMGDELYGLENDIKKFQQNGSQLTQINGMLTMIQINLILLSWIIGLILI